MPFTMKNNITKIAVFCLTTIGFTAFAQENGGTPSSPYSLYGLGTVNQTTTGKINTLGKFGFAINSEEELNSLNPASYATIGGTSFFFDLGVKGGTETFSDHNGETVNYTANFSNLAFAFSITPSSGVGLSLSPYTDVGYNISGIETEIEGSTSTFYSDVYGTGGLNDLTLNYGYAINDKLRIGATGTYLFGQITQIEINYLAGNVLQVEDENNYSGARLGLGFQYEPSKKISFGGVVNLPTVLKGSQTQTVSQLYEDDIIDEQDIDDFKLPLEIGLGFKGSVYKGLSLNVDYKKSFWDNTNQSDYFGDYVDKDALGVGLEYFSEKSDYKYKNTIRYRAGFNYDNGNLLIADKRVNNYAFNLGLGLPLSKGTSSMLNVNYSYGGKGQVSNGYVKENYHLISLNFSLEGIWFLKRKL